MKLVEKEILFGEQILHVHRKCVRDTDYRKLSVKKKILWKKNDPLLFSNGA